MFEAEVLEDEARERRTSARRPDPRREPAPENKRTVLPKHPVCLKTDGRHFFFAPSVWSA